MAEQRGEIVIYKAGDGQTAIDVRLQDETVWLSLNQIAALFQRDKSVISRHMRNIFQQKELSRNSTVAKFATVQKEGSREISRDIEYYNLDVIISTGYRVNSKRGTQFRIWATNVLQDHLDKDFTLCFPTLYSAGTSAILTLPRQRSNTLALRPGYY